MLIAVISTAVEISLIFTVLNNKTMVVKLGLLIQVNLLIIQNRNKNNI